MTRLELLQATETFCNLLVQNNVTPKEVRYIPLYQTYKRLESEGHKKSYIYWYLADQYGIDQRSVVRVLRRLESDIVMSPKKH